MNVLYVYSVTRDVVMPEVDGVDGTRRFAFATADGVSAVYSAVPADEYSQEVIDRRAGDLEWLGAIGYRHQAVVSDVMKRTAIVPLRAFTLFRSEESLRTYLLEQHDMLDRALERLDGKQEWTLRVEFEPERWSEALAARVQPLRELQEQIADAAPGKAFLLRKKLDEERKRASHAAEQAVIAEIESVVLQSLRCDTVSETREHRAGAFPQINVLINRDEEAHLQELHEELGTRYAREGVTLALSGPWPPYTFASIGTRETGA